MLVADHPDLIVDAMDTSRGPLLTYVHTTRTPPGEVLEQAADAAERGYDLRRARLLVLTDGGSPSGVARKKMITRLSQHADKPPIALVSDAPAIRFVVSTLVFFDPNVQVFSPKELLPALGFLHLSPDDRRLVHEMLVTLQQRTTGRFLALEAAVRGRATTLPSIAT